MTTAYKSRVTIVVPEQHITKANAIALVLGESINDDQTFTQANWQDAQGNKYAVASTVAKDVFLTGASRPLTAPNHAPNADVALASQAQAILALCTQTSPVTANPDQIVVVVGDNTESATDHVSAVGVELIPIEEEF